jgi:hypothetical protein
MKVSLFYRIAAVLLLLFQSDIHLVFASPIPHSFQRSQSEAVFVCVCSSGTTGLESGTLYSILIRPGGTDAIGIVSGNRREGS